MPSHSRRSRVLNGFLVRSTVLHVLIHVAIGAASYRLVSRVYWTGAEALSWPRDPEGEDGFVHRWFLPAQVVRRILHGVALYPPRGALLDMGRWGGLVLALLLVLIGTIAGTVGAIKEWVYRTTFHPGHFLTHLPEIVLQTLLYGCLLLAWERRAGRARS